jgi:hypothetical protein
MSCSSQLDNFTPTGPTVACLLECLTIEEPEAQEWFIMAAINIGTLLKYGWPQGVVRVATRQCPYSP